MAKLNTRDKRILGGLLCELIIDLDKTIHDHAPKIAELLKETPEGTEKYLRERFLIRTQVHQDRFMQMYLDSLIVTPPENTPPPAS